MKIHWICGRSIKRRCGNFTSIWNSHRNVFVCFLQNRHIIEFILVGFFSLLIRQCAYFFYRRHHDWSRMEWKERNKGKKNKHEKWWRRKGQLGKVSDGIDFELLDKSHDSPKIYCVRDRMVNESEYNNLAWMHAYLYWFNNGNCDIRRSHCSFCLFGCLFLPFVKRRCFFDVPYSIVSTHLFDIRRVCVCVVL